MMHALPTSYDTLAADMDATLEQLKTILTNPNFVSLQEVEERDEEIARLREGWVRMEHRWRDVLLMMEGWRRKMDTGHTINLDDLRQGMGLVSPERLSQGKKANGEERDEPEQSFAESNSMSEIQLPSQGSDEMNSSGILEPPRLSSVAKAKSSPTKRKRDVLEPPDFFDLRPTGSKSMPTSPEHEDVSDPSAEQAEDEENSLPQMTIAQKLDLAREEAEAAAAAKSSNKTSKIPLKSTSGNASKTSVPSLGLDGAADEVDDDTLGKMMPSPMAKKTKIKGRPRRRKSTLSPEELEELMVGALE